MAIVKIKRNNRELKDKLCSRALSRFFKQECERERDRHAIPWELSIYALADYVLAFGGECHECAKPEINSWLFDERITTLVAVSGGGDSVAMLWLLRTFSAGKVIVAHVNHGLRGSESDGDAEFVKSLARDWNLEFMERDIDVQKERETRMTGESLELAARSLRHSALLDMASETGASLIALGHNRDDLAETVLFNLLRGTGIRGAVGIPVQRDKFFRPVLGLRREFLRQILTVRDIPWREDYTNSDASISTRNFIRLELLPLIEKHVNTGAIEHLASFAEEMRGIRYDEEQRAFSLLNELIIKDESDIVLLKLDRPRMSSLTNFERTLVIRAIGWRLGLTTLSRSRVQELSWLIARKGPFTFQWNKNCTVYGSRGIVQLATARL